MKSLIAITAFTLGVVISAFVVRSMERVHRAQRDVQLLSDVHWPLRMCLDDIVATYDRGDAALAEQKARLLQKRWTDYLTQKTRAPEQFASEIVELRAPTTQAGREGS